MVAKKESARDHERERSRSKEKCAGAEGEELVLS